MNYFQPYPPVTDESAAAWQREVAAAAKTPGLARILAERGGDLFPCFAGFYRQLRSMPRNSRRALQRHLAAPRALTAVFQERIGREIGDALQCKLAQTIAGAALLLALGQGTGLAATINVTTTAPGISSDGRCSLIEAIINANADAAVHPDCAAGLGADTIVLRRNSTHRLASAYTEYYGATALPVISSEITIAGNGAKITRHKNAPAFRHIAVGRMGTLTLLRTNLSGGLLDLNGPSYIYGGGSLLNLGTLTIEESTISGNTVQLSGFYYNAFGGGILNHFGTLTISNSDLSDNKAIGGPPYYIGFGGGLDATGGTTTISSSTISGNKANYGGGIYHFLGTFTIENSVVSKNRGGGISNNSPYITSSIHGSTITRNTAPFGGGVGNGRGYLAITESSIDDNFADYNGGGVYNGGVLLIEKTTISGNIARDKSGTYYSSGGGFANGRYGTLTIHNSTVSGNSADLGGGGLNFYGANLAVENSTFTQNKAHYLGGGLSNYVSSYFPQVSVITLSNSLISGNDASVSGSEIFNSGEIYSQGVNLLGSNGNSGVVGFTPGAFDIVPPAGMKTNRILGPLKRNGGPTKTHGLLRGSPAVDAIPPGDPGCAGTDQRGVARPQAAGCDIGAFER